MRHHKPILPFLFILFASLIRLSRQKTSTANEENTESRDGWSEWSEWSSCSRTCGGGVAVQSRRCLKWQGCKGNSVRYNLCQDIPCPDASVDFLAMQCSEHDNAFLDGDQQKWEPSPGGDLCVLTCKVQGTNGPPVVLSPRVLDGTRCGEDNEGVCIHGQCQTIGCDKVLGSKLIVDACGVCGGSGESCGANSIRWRRKNNGPCSATCGGGYRMLAARCENSTTGAEIHAALCKRLPRPAPIISTCGEAPCPASWQIGEWQKCSRSCSQGFQAREVFCTQNKNGTVTRIADYSCPETRPAHIRSCAGDCPSWSEGFWSQCSVTCGDGLQRRTVSCRNPDGEASDMCNFSQRPNSTRPCRTGVKCNFSPPTQIFMPNWLKDSMEDVSLFPTLREESAAMEAGRVPSEPTFIAGRWSSCSTSCGEGVRTRNVTCKIYLEFSQTVPILPDAQCSGKRPVEAKRCFLRPCGSSPDLQDGNGFINQSQGEDPNLQAKIPFSSFEDPPGPPGKNKKSLRPPSKLLQSLEEDPSVIADDSHTLEFGSPNSEESLDSLYPMVHHSAGGGTSLNSYIYHNEVFQEENYVWKEGGYTPCSRSCLGGVQDLEFHCINIKEANRGRVPGHMCDPKKKPDSITKTCNDHPCPPRWDVSAFDKCSKSCGGGITRRRIVCIHEMTRSGSGKMTVSNHLCPQPPPYAQKYCNMEPCAPKWVTSRWSRCSKDCANGAKTRRIRCVQTFSSDVVSVPEDRCPKTKPATQRKCMRKSCRKKKFGNSTTGPMIRSLDYQNYRQKKYMKTVVLKIGGRASVFHGAKIKVRCPTRRFDRRRISWWRNGMLLGPMEVKLDRIRVSKKGVLKINRIEYTDAGIYFCKAGPKEANLTLKVQPLPASFASSEEALRPPEVRAREYNKWKFGSNNIRIHSLEERPPSSEVHATRLLHESGPPQKASSSVSFLANKNASIGPSDNMPADVMATSGPQRVQDHFKMNLHTMEEISGETPVRPFIYGKLSESGIPAGRVEPRGGIGLLSEKVARSRARDRAGGGGGLFDPSQSRLRDPEERFFGIVQNRTQAAQVNSEERHHQFAIVRESESNSKSSSVSGSSSMNPSFQEALLSTSKEHKERSTNSDFSIKDLEELTKGKPILGDAHRRTINSDTLFQGPRLLGKGTKENLEFEWRVSNWTACTQTCSFTGSSGGFQYRRADCIVKVDEVSTLVDDALCLDVGLATPLTHQRCGFQDCPQWRVGDWSACENSRCYTLHYALQKREVVCALFNGSSTSEGLCDEITKPRHKRECFNRQCVGVWRTGEWSQCTAPCGGQGYRTRLLQCVWNGTKKSAGNACREKPRPEVVRWCDGLPCPDEADKSLSNSSSPPAGRTRQGNDQHCQDQSRYCRIVVRINMCQHYHHKCCKSCQ